MKPAAAGWIVTGEVRQGSAYPWLEKSSWMDTVLPLWVTCSSEKVFPNVQYKPMKPCLYDYCPLQCAWHYWGEFGSGFLVSALCIITGCCSSPQLTRLSKPAPQPVLWQIWEHHPSLVLKVMNILPILYSALKILNILLQTGSPKPNCPLCLFHYIHMRIFILIFYDD